MICNAADIVQQTIRCWAGRGCRTVATVIADWTGVPLSSLMKDEQTELLSLEGNLNRGWWAGCGAECHRPAPACVKTGAPENGPQGVFLLVGPSGTGKTETALALADALFGGEKSLITINLSEYQEPHTVSQLKVLRRATSVMVRAASSPRRCASALQRGAAR
jgi:type VI secretion system protein VasG